jgi:hypothetical protein
VKKLWKWHRGRAEFRAAADEHEARLSLPELEEAVRSVEPSALLVPSRVLRRVVRVHASLGGFGFRVPHSKTYVIPSPALLEIADRDELGLKPTECLPQTIILLERPSADDLEEQSRRELLLHYWELLFHARVHREFTQALVVPASAASLDGISAKAGTTSVAIAQRVEELGKFPFDEIRNVLQQERFLLPPYNDSSVYVEFAAVYLGMRYFKPFLLCSFFPALPSLDEVDQVIAQDVDAVALLDATRLPGTPEPDELREAARLAAEAFDADPLAEVFEYPDEPGEKHAPHRIPVGQRSMAKYQNWSQGAVRHTARGNLAGAVARRARAEAWVPREKAAMAATALREEVNHFVERLQAALEIEDDDPRPWRESLLALAHQVPRGLWTVEARLLYDLQKACIDQERATSTVDVMHWVLSFGRRAICRDLPDQRRVAMARHLRSAQRRLARVRISDRQRRQLAEVLDEATTKAEDQLREVLRPKIASALEAIDLWPKNLPEEISRRKLVEELLDRIVERGFLTLGEVRDSISRNHLKEPDCSGPKSFLRGEAALRADRRLIDALDGVYEPGDFYCRWLLRLSHIMFGTPVGRFLTLFFVIPIGGAAVAAIGLDHFIELIFRFHPQLAPKPEQWPETFHAIGTGEFPAELTPILVMAILICLLVNVRWFRNAVVRALKWAGQAINAYVVPVLDKLFRNSLARLIAYLLLRPIIPTLVLAAMSLPFVPRPERMLGLAIIYVGVMVALNSRIGRDVEEVAWDATAQGWQRFGWRPLVGLFWFVLDVSRQFLQGFERVLYTVDEWLRFRSGQSRAVLVAKGGLGVIWFFIAYLIRIFVNLLLEPQLNPLKHVPWVSVSHKIMLPMWPKNLPELIADRIHMNQLLAWLLAGVIVTGTPGIFGFLIWELKENWQLFAANRRKTLRAVLIGSHGETMTRLLRPGIHSGTIPKRFAKLRRAERKALRGADPGAARKHREALHHVEIYLRRYIEREFVAWFVESCGWSGPPPRTGDIHLSTAEASIEVEFDQPAEGRRTMAFRLMDGAVQLEPSGQICLEQLPPIARNVYLLAFTNVLKTGCVAVLADGESPIDVGAVVISWSDWIAAWENIREPSDRRIPALVPLHESAR